MIPNFALSNHQTKQVRSETFNTIKDYCDKKPARKVGSVLGVPGKHRLSKTVLMNLSHEQTGQRDLDTRTANMVHNLDSYGPMRKWNDKLKPVVVTTQEMAEWMAKEPIHPAWLVFLRGFFPTVNMKRILLDCTEKSKTVLDLVQYFASSVETPVRLYAPIHFGIVPLSISTPYSYIMKGPDGYKAGFRFGDVRQDMNDQELMGETVLQYDFEEDNNHISGTVHDIVGKPDSQGKVLQFALDHFRFGHTFDGMLRQSPVVIPPLNETVEVILEDLDITYAMDYLKLRYGPMNQMNQKAIAQSIQTKSMLLGDTLSFREPTKQALSLRSYLTRCYLHGWLRPLFDQDILFQVEY